VNLISNAMKFSEPNATVSIQAQTQDTRVMSRIQGKGRDQDEAKEFSADDAPPLQILFQVTDQGKGIPADKLEIIFDRFQQVSASDSRDKGGTGLGLSICRNIVQQHKGRIWVESTLGKGSTFYFTLPLSPH
jgi:signal transduction histidine kinase